MDSLLVQFDFTMSLIIYFIKSFNYIDIYHIQIYSFGLLSYSDYSKLLLRVTLFVLLV